MRALIISFLFAMILVKPVFAQSPNNVGQIERDELEQILASYTANRTKLPKYLVAAQADYSKIYRLKPERSFSRLDWYLVYKNQKDGQSRFDVFLQDSLFAKTLLSSSEFVKEFASSTKAMSLDLTKIEPEKLERLRLASPSIHFDPWNIPMMGGTTLAARNDLPSEMRYEDSLTTPGKLVSFLKLNPKTIDCHFNILKDQRINLAIRFEKFDDSHLPVQATFYQKEGGRKWEMSTVQTKWIRVANCWVPSHASVSEVIGNPTIPSTFKEIEMEFFWVPADKLPQEIFRFEDHQLLISSMSLRDYAAKFGVTSNLPKTK